MKIKLVSIAIIAFLLLIGNIVSSNIHNNSEENNILRSKIDGNKSDYWLTFQHDNSRSGFTNLTGNGYNWEIKHQYNLGERVLNPVVGDLDDDGSFEVVFSTNDYSNALPLFVLDVKSETIKWTFTNHTSGIWSTPTIADLNGDGLKDIVFGSGYQDGHIYAIYHNGTKMWDYFTGDSTNSIDGHSCVADVDGDGNPEVLIGGSCYYSSGDHFFVLNGENGSLLWSKQVGSSMKATLTAPTIGEFDGDVGVEVVIGDYDGYVHVYNGEDGSIVWNKYLGGYIESTPALVDKNNDNIDDIAIAADGTIYLIDGSNPDNIFWSEITTGIAIPGGISCADIDGDTEEELVYYPYSSSFVEALDLNGDVEWYANVGSDNVYASPAPALADIDRDGEIEVIIQTRSSGKIQSLNGENGSVEYEISLGYQSISSPAIADVDTDGYADIITGCDDGFLFVVGNPTESHNLISNLSSGWNFISLPFNQSIQKEDVHVSYGGSSYSWDEAVSNGFVNNYIFGWNRIAQSYGIYSTFIAGDGYWLYSNVDCTLWIENITFLPDSYITTMKNNWNIVGVPNNQIVEKMDLVVLDNGIRYTWSEAVNNGLVSNYIFGWNSIAQSYSLDSTLNPGKAYWIFSYIENNLYIE